MGALIGLAGSGRRCHTAVHGEECYGSVVWQMISTRGVPGHTEWKSSLTKNSSFEDFQAWMHKQNPAVCPEPCRPRTTSSEFAGVGDKSSSSGRAMGSVQLGLMVPGQDAEKEDAACHTAVKKEPRYTSVTWAMTDGIFNHPEWYDGLTQSSEFENF